MEPNTTEQLTLKELTRKQRRVLGVLLEKAFTTPEYYPLTLKAVTTGCNQKNNRDPVVSYEENAVADTLEELQRMGLVGVLHTETGRTERYRHYMRQRFSFTEPQLAILTELLLRGRQQLGELRTRASRMVPIDTLEQLRTELQGLIDQKIVQANGPLDRRGIEVDHNLYPAGENHPAMPSVAEEPRPAPAAALSPAPPSRTSASSGAPVGATDLTQRVAMLESSLNELRREHQELQSELGSLRDELRELQDRFADLRRDLGA